MDIFFNDEILNWDESIELVFSDYSIFSFLSNAFFTNTHYFLDCYTKLSFVDLLLINDILFKNQPIDLFTFLIYDLFCITDNVFLTSQVIFYSDYQNFFTFISYHSPELSFALTDYFLTYNNSLAVNFSPSIVFDTYNDNLNITISEFLEYFFLFFTFV